VGGYTLIASARWFFPGLKNHLFLNLQAILMPMENTLRELVQVISEALVDYPDEVSVKEIEGGQTCVLELKVAKQDLGKVIGKGGRTAQSLRTILNAASAKMNKRTVLEIIE
jgi:hypothetical protein